MAKRDVWNLLLDGLDQPMARGCLVLLGVAILLSLRLMLVAVALPLMAYWHWSNQAPEAEEEREPAPAERAGHPAAALSDEEEEEDDDDDDAAGLDFPDLRMGPDDLDPYNMSFWGDKAPGKSKAFPEHRSLPTAPAQKSWQRREQESEGFDLGLGSSVGLLDDSGDCCLPPSVRHAERSGDSDFSFDFLGGLDGGMGGFEQGDGKGKAKSKGKGKGKGDGVPGSIFPRLPDPTRQIFVANIGDLMQEELTEFFEEEVGEVASVKVLTRSDGGTTRSRGVAFVTFGSVELTRRAMGLRHVEINGRRLVIQEPRGIGQGKDSTSPPGSEPFGAPMADRSRGGGAGGFGKGGKGRSEESQPRSEIDDILDEALQEEDGPLRTADFDSGAKRLLTELMKRDRAQGTERSVEALETVLKQCRKKPRESVRKWTAYVYTLLEKFDPELCDELSARKVSGGGERTARGEVPRENDVKRAWQCVPEPGEGARQVLDRWGKPVLLY